MKNFFAALLLTLSLLPGLVSAQNRQPIPPANLQGQPLRDWLRQNWYDPYRTVLSYAAARGKMYNYADNYNNQVRCVYSGYVENVPYSTTGTSTGVVNRINCEHTVPQSWFNQTVRMRSDMHHLFPTYDTWNNLRGSDPFADIPDATTVTWMRNTTSQSTIPTTNIDEWSEDTNIQFEPREDHKGNIARAIFYFYTMHGGQPELVSSGHNNINSVADINTLYAWHLADPVDAHEIERDRRVMVSQGNHNPYIFMPSLVATAWGLAPAGPAITFAAAAGSISEGNGGTTTYTITLNLASALAAATTVQVSVDATASTATNGTDFTYTTPSTVTFAAGQTTATTTVSIIGDTQPELDETVVLNLTTPGPGASIGTANTHTLTILNDDGAAPTLAFASASGSAPEGNSGTSTYTVNVTLATPGTLAFPLTVPVVVGAGSTASSPSDYTLTTTTLTFPSATALTQPITVTIVGDVVPEPNETVILTLGTPSRSGVIVAGGTHTLVIVNDDVVPGGVPCGQLFFTQYVESNVGNTKVLELYNPTAAPMSLAGKRIELFSNGNTNIQATENLTGTIPAGGTYVIANTGVTDAGVAAIANLQSSVAFFNGDDAIVLFDGTDTLDVIGVVGQRPATGWATPGGGSTLNNTLVRSPNTDIGGRWNGPNGSATWLGGGVDVFTGLGSFTSAVCPTVTGTRSAAALPRALEIYPNPASESVRVRLPGSAAAQSATIELLDALGRTVRTRTAPLGGTDAALLDLRGLPAGLYAVRVACAGVAYAGRVVVQ